MLRVGSRSLVEVRGGIEKYGRWHGCGLELEMQDRRTRFLVVRGMSGYVAIVPVTRNGPVGSGWISGLNCGPALRLEATEIARMVSGPLNEPRWDGTRSWKWVAWTGETT